MTMQGKIEMLYDCISVALKSAKEYNLPKFARDMRMQCKGILNAAKLLEIPEEELLKLYKWYYNNIEDEFLKIENNV